MGIAAVLDDAKRNIIGVRRDFIMKSCVKTLVFFGVLFLVTGASWLNAQVTNAVRAHINHSFVIGNTTYPPGDYTFRVVQDSDLSIMNVEGNNNKINSEFLVRQAMDDHTPRHTEVLFRKYGNTEFLSKIFESGSKSGEEVTETSRQEARFVKDGQHPIEHSEEQK
jgi:hypothetical protein